MYDFSETLKKFEAILKQQADRVERLKNEGDFVDYTKLDKNLLSATLFCRTSQDSSTDLSCKVVL